MSVDMHRVTLGHEIGVFAHGYDMFDSRFVTQLDLASASRTNQHHRRSCSYCQFILGGTSAGLANKRMQNSCQDEQFERIIHRSARESQRFAALAQLFGRERLRHIANLVEHHLALRRMTHVVGLYILIQPRQGLFVWQFGLHAIGLIYAR